MLGGVALDLEIAISVPLIECLVDDVRYFRSDTLRPPQGENCDHFTVHKKPAGTRVPSFQALVRLAVKRDHAQQAAKQVKRQRWWQRSAPPRP